LTKGRGVSLASPDGAFSLELNYYEDGSAYNAPYVTGEGLDHLAFLVDDLTKALDEAKSGGYNPILKLEAGNFRWAYIQDPNGIWIELFGRSDYEWLLEHKEDIVI
jgi:catechol 2,3-dioxygenase-like lactoylglutathione lyase family enzyme